MKTVWVVLCLMVASSVLANQAVLTTTDFSSGSVSSLDLDTHVASNDHVTIHADAVVRTFGNKAYVINRLGQDNVLVLGGNDLSSPVIQFSTGNGSNPQDIVVVSDQKAYVSLYGRNHVLIVNPSTGDSIGAVSLSGFADADGFPEMSNLAQYGNRLFVACQRLDQVNGFGPADFSVIAVIDMATDTLEDMDAVVSGVQGIVMAGKNPTSADQLGEKWVFTMVNTFGDLTDGGVEVVNLASLQSEGIGVGEAVIGGNVNTLSLVSKTVGYVVYSDANFVNYVRPFDVSSSSVSENLSGISGGFVSDLGVYANRLYVLDQGSFTDPSSGGVKVFNVNTQAQIAGPIQVGLPPSSIAFLQGAAQTQASDFDASGKVDFADFLAFAGAFGKKLGESGYDTRFDLDGSGAVDFADFLQFVSAFGADN